MEVSKNLKWHKSVVKRYFKQTKIDLQEGTTSNPLTRFVRSYLPYLRSDFKFTLMHAQHTYAKIFGFRDWKELKDYCEGGLNAQT